MYDIRAEGGHENGQEQTQNVRSCCQVAADRGFSSEGQSVAKSIR